MIFSSIPYLAFLLVVVLLYWQLGRRAQNLFLWAASYFFYACWDPRFLLLIFFSTSVDWICGRQIARESSQQIRRRWLFFSLASNLGLLGYFKYFNFFSESLVALLARFDVTVSHTTAHILLPVGISFFTLQSMSYTIDIYRRKLEPVRSFIDYATFVAFFPQLVAGPIVRASEFLFQLDGKRVFSWKQFESGVLTFLLGFLKKACIADPLGVRLVNPVFDSPQSFDTGSLWLAVIAYSIQLYADFSGYSSMAIGSARLLGFEIPENFSFPYLSCSVPEYWRRWHITMSRFFRDYVYIPLGGSKCGQLLTLRNIVLTTFLSGLWHGASWNFIIWGLLHGFFISVYSVWHFSDARKKVLTNSWFGVLIAWSLTQLCIILTRVFFRSKDLSTSGIFLTGMAGSTGSESLGFDTLAAFAFAAIVFDHLYGFLSERKFDLRQVVPKPIQALVYAILLLVVFHTFSGAATPFIYFAF